MCVSRQLVGLLLVAGAIAGGPMIAQNRDRSNLLRDGTADDTARNVLLFVGNGLGDSEITLARNYALGAAGRLALDSLPFTGVYTTYSIEERDSTLPNYVTDSAAAGTAWATGVKTSNGRISTTAASNRVLKTVLELAQERGWRTGDVTTAELTDATPAVLASHVRHRSCQGPADMARCPQDAKEAGGPGSIAEQMIEHRVDVLLGGGLARFDQATSGGTTVLQSARGHDYRVVRDATELSNLRPGGLVLGLFAPGTMSVEWGGLEARPYPSNIGSPQTCQTGRRPSNEPSLAEMTTKAIELLDQGGRNGPGFFLQVEGASIDKQDHAANPCAQIGETIAFDRAVKVGVDYAHAHPDTLLVVTADHGHTSQIVSLPTETNHPTGPISVLLTADGAPLTVSYGTNGYCRSQDHTGTQVRIAAMGPHAPKVAGVLDQTDLFRLISKALGVATASDSHSGRAVQR